MSRGLTDAPYLTAVLTIQRDTGHNFRRTRAGSMPITRYRLSCVRNQSFLFSTIRLRNATNPALRSSPSIEHFELNLKKSIHELYPILSSFVLWLYRQNSCKSHTLSALKCQRFQYNFADNMSCDKCGATRGDVVHLLFHCPAYAVPRHTLSVIAPNFTWWLILFRSQTNLEKHLLYGSNVSILSDNLTIFKLLRDFLLASGRFG